jgi:hypothetical protein
VLARAGRRVVVHEAQREVGYRFQGDLQGLENWTTECDVLDELREMGLTAAFAQRACREGTVFDAWGQAYPVRSRAPLFYMVERGPGPGSLDTALFEQARALGVEVRFGSRLEELAGPGILAVGPKAADAIAVGYHFDTGMDDGFWAICDETLAPQGYAYLLVMNGRGTVKSCMYTGFKQEALYVQRTVAAFERLAGLKMETPGPTAASATSTSPRRPGPGAIRWRASRPASRTRSGASACGSRSAPACSRRAASWTAATTRRAGAKNSALGCAPRSSTARFTARWATGVTAGRCAGRWGAMRARFCAGCTGPHSPSACSCHGPGGVIAAAAGI